MATSVGRLGSLSYLAMRVVFAFLFMSHGYDRAIKGVWPFLMLDVANVIEIVAGPLLLIGLFTPIVAVVASGEMAVAYFVAHAPQAKLPLNNMGEITVALCFGFLYIATRGGGRYSVDALRGKAGDKDR